MKDEDKTKEQLINTTSEESELSEETINGLTGLLDTLPFYVMLVDEHHYILLANKAVKQNLEVAPKEIVGGYCPKVAHGLDEPYPGCPLEEAIKVGHAVEREFFDPDSGRWVTSAIYPTKYLTKEGRAIFIHSIHDITEKKRAAEEIQRNYQIQTVVNSLLGISLEDIPLEELLKLTIDLILSITWLAFESKGSIFLVEDDPEVLIMKCQNGLGEPVQKTCARVPFGRCLCGRAALTREIQFADCLDERHETRYEGITPHGHYCVPILFEGRTLGVINMYLKEGHCRDEKEEEFLASIANVLAGIIARRQTEEEKEKIQAQLFQSQKMESIGTLAGGVAHDFNNILTTIIGYSGLVLNSLNQDNPLREYIKEVTKAGEQAASLTRQLLMFSRKQTLQSKTLSLNAVISDMDKMLHRLIGEDIELIIIPELNLENVKADPGQIVQIIVNLAVNARAAMPKGGKLTIKTENVIIDEKHCKIIHEAREGKFVCLSVADTGIGMSKKTIERIFEPFFTTKAAGEGTGLGLSVVYGIVKQHQGWIEVYSKPGEGSTFNIYLPAFFIESEDETEETVLSHEFCGSNERILLVEDEEGVREFAQNALSLHGYVVFEAASAQEALSIFEKEKGDFHIVLSDVVLPGKNGLELVDQLLSLNPKLKILLASGYTDEKSQLPKIQERGFQFLNKPYTLTNLLRVIREVIER